MSFQDTFKALSDPVRREILTMLKDERKSAGEISQKFDMTGATVSYHLSILKKADLISETKYKNFIYYDLNASVFEELLLWISQFNGIRNNSEENTETNETDVIQNSDSAEGKSSVQKNVENQREN